MHSVDPAITAVLKAERLSEKTKRVNGSKLAIIAQAAGGRPLLMVLTQNPDKVIKYITEQYSEMASQKTMLVSVTAGYRLLDLKTKAHSSYNLYLELFDKLKSVLRERSKTNLPT